MAAQECNITLEREQINIQYSGSYYVPMIIDKVVEAWQKTIGKDATPDEVARMRRELGRG